MHPKVVTYFALLSGLAGRAGLVVKAVAGPHALHIAVSAFYSLILSMMSMFIMRNLRPMSQSIISKCRNRNNVKYGFFSILQCLV